MNILCIYCNVFREVREMIQALVKMAQWKPYHITQFNYRIREFYLTNGSELDELRKKVRIIFWNVCTKLISLFNKVK